MSKSWQKEFDKCPACGENKPFFKTIVDELKQAGRVPKEWNFSLDAKQGVVYPPDRLQTLPIGSLLPGFEFAEDFCSECGCRYAVRLARREGRTSLPPAQGLNIPKDLRSN